MRYRRTIRCDVWFRQLFGKRVKRSSRHALCVANSVFADVRKRDAPTRVIADENVRAARRQRKNAAFFVYLTLAALSFMLSAPLMAADPASIADALKPFIDRHELAGAVTLVVSKDKILSLEAVGYADIAARRPMRTDTLFWIASMSKPITATAIMLLVDEGKVNLDDSVEKYLPRFAPRIIAVSNDGSHAQLQKTRRAITVRNLLSHMSGLHPESSLETPTRDSFPLALDVDGYALEPLDFEPGEGWNYSNAGINAAGRIIEVVSGMRYEDFMQKRLFDPLQMFDTTFWPSEAQLTRLAKSYRVDDAGSDLREVSITQLRYPLSDHIHRYPMPAGGLFSTASDLAKFCQMLLNGGILAGKRYLSESAIQEMTRDQVSAAVKRLLDSQWPAGRGYGLGWWTKPGGIFGHGGAYLTDMNIDPLHGLATVWLVQHAEYRGDGAKSEDVFDQTVSKLFIADPKPFIASGSSH